MDAAAARETITTPPVSRELERLNLAGGFFTGGYLRTLPGTDAAELVGRIAIDRGKEVPPDVFCVFHPVSAGGSAGPVGLEARIPLPETLGSQSGAKLSPDFKWLLSYGVGRANNVSLQRLTASGECSPPAVLPEGVRDVGAALFSPDGRWLVIAMSPGIAKVFDLSSGDQEKAVASGRLLSENLIGCVFLAFSPDSTSVCMVGAGELVRVEFMDPAIPPVNLRTAGGRGLAASFSPDGKWVFAGGHDRVIRAWRVAGLKNGEPPLEFRGLPTAVMDITMTPDGRTLVATGLNGTYRRWAFDGFSTGALPVLTGGNGGSILDLALSPDKKWIAAGCAVRDGGGNAGEVVLTDAGGQGKWELTPHAGEVTGTAFSPDGRWLGSIGRDARVHLYDFPAVTRCIAEKKALPGPVCVLKMEGTRLQYDRRLAFHPRGTLYATCGDGILFEWNLNDADPSAGMRQHPIHTIHYLLPDVKVSPDGHWLAVCRHGWDSTPVEGSTQKWNMVLLYDVSQPGPPVPRAELPAFFLGTTDVQFSADSRWLVSGSAGCQPAIWDLSSPDPASTVRRPPAAVTGHMLTGISFSPDRPWLAIGGNEGRIYLWDWRNGTELRTITTREQIRSLQWLSDGRLLSGGSRGQVAIWETDLPKLIGMARKVAGRALSEKERIDFRVAALRN
jgi:WD40 repeat protein